MQGTVLEKRVQREKERAGEGRRRETGGEREKEIEGADTPESCRTARFSFWLLLICACRKRADLPEVKERTPEKM